MKWYSFEEIALGFVFVSIGVGILTASGCGIAWQMKKEKFKECSYERDHMVRHELEQLKKAISEFENAL